jgi:hypothetical protein
MKKQFKSLATNNFARSLGKFGRVMLMLIGVGGLTSAPHKTVEAQIPSGSYPSFTFYSEGVAYVYCPSYAPLINGVCNR